MAGQKALEKFGELLNCPICLGPYTDPKILQCFHVYCQDCLIKLVCRGNKGNHTLKCPECRRVVPVPANGVVGFQAAYRITEYQEIHRALVLAPRKVKYCTVHERKELELYCETCEELICWRCAYRGGQHHSHGHQDVDKVFEAFKGHILPKLEGLRHKLNGLLRAVDKMQHSPCVSMSSGHELIKYHETVLGDVKTRLTAAKTKLKHLFNLAKHSRKADVLLNKSKLLSGLSGVEEVVQSSTSKLEEPDPLLCCVSLEGLQPATAGETGTAVLDVANFLPVSAGVLLKSLHCEILVSGTSAAAIECSVERKQGRCRYLPASP